MSIIGTPHSGNLTAHLRELRELALEAIDRWEDYARAIYSNEGNCVSDRVTAGGEFERAKQARKVIKP